MICAPYKNLNITGKLANPNFEKALTWLKKDTWKDLPLGKTEIDGSKLYVVRSSYKSKPLGECLYESHRLYADIQIAIKGCELVYVCRREGLKIVEAYSPEKDVDLLEGEPENVDMVVLDFPLAVVLFPWDIHMPSVAPGDNVGEVEKIVLKVALK